ncbi:unnamed protein product [Arctogadus glacialis]
MESEQLYSRGYCRTGYSSYNSITSASSDEELLDSAGATMDFHTTEDDNLLDGDTASSPGSGRGVSGLCHSLPSVPSDGVQREDGVACEARWLSPLS